ncbi:YjbF family lipoprotein [Glacieibacterium megasporae]|uniref:YjbF family lipoprotein n=1 Tax=Glacieibacterium megasporae TaxID=2835787 RepID=UPI001C1E7BC6|nr:YjbF family lipoprotein [Polymorphobacter megasporae]UAJ10382.1 YjbF family lipoprotein [Polymorphobacter megasporae]
MVERLNRRHVVAGLGAGLLASCAGLRKGSAFYGTITGYHPGGGDSDTRAYANSLPYASMLFWIDGHSRDLVVLGSFDPDNRLTWYTADKQSITTYGPFIVATVGTEVDLVRTDFGPGWATDPRSLVGKTLDRTTVVSRRADATVHLRSTFHDAGLAQVKILGTAMQLHRIDEAVIANGRTRFLNSYWIDADGACFKSRQQALPTVQPVNIEILKYPAQT